MVSSREDLTYDLFCHIAGKLKGRKKEVGSYRVGASLSQNNFFDFDFNFGCDSGDSFVS